MLLSGLSEKAWRSSGLRTNFSRRGTAGVPLCWGHGPGRAGGVLYFLLELLHSSSPVTQEHHCLQGTPPGGLLTREQSKSQALDGLLRHGNLPWIRRVGQIGSRSRTRNADANLGLEKNFRPSIPTQEKGLWPKVGSLRSQEASPVWGLAGNAFACELGAEAP